MRSDIQKRQEMEAGDGPGARGPGNNGRQGTKGSGREADRAERGGNLAWDSKREAGQEGGAERGWPGGRIPKRGTGKRAGAQKVVSGKRGNGKRGGP